MPSFLEQLRDLLAPRYVLEDELGTGGMGKVYRATDTKLPRLVAVKVLIPEKADEEFRERFQREVRRLAELEHPNIVRVYDVSDEASPYFYYIMEHLEGETLAARLARGALALRETSRLGRELLEALKLAHRHGVIHRDIKPSNIFLSTDGRVVLIDFGIAKSLTDPATPVTEKGKIVATRQCSAPEQMSGQAFPQTDFYLVSMVLYESLTGLRWSRENEPQWARIPRWLRRTLRRALPLSPEARWPDAAAFQRALERPRSISQRVVFGAALLVLGIVAVREVVGVLHNRARAVSLRIDRLDGPRVLGSLNDSVPALVAHLLTAYPDFSVTGPESRQRAKVVVSGSLRLSGPSLIILLRVGAQAPLMVSTTITEWRAAGELLADSLLLRLYSSSPLDSLLPVRVMPQEPEGLRVFLGAEKAFARAWWDSAYVGYGAASALDPSCGLCRWRHAEVARFLSQPPDSDDAAVYRTQLAGFPSRYQSLIRAERMPLSARLDSLIDLDKRSPKFLFGLFRLGDELLHRGPLLGRPRRDASGPLTQAVDARPDFAPAWEHLLWLWIAEGRERNAVADLDTLRFLAPPRGGSTAIRDLLQGAFAWRFLPAGTAARLTDSIVGPARRRHEPLDAGARYLNAFDAQQGAIALGASLDSANDHRESAMLAQVFGYLALGKLHRCRELLARLHEQFGDERMDLFALELEAMLTMFDPDAAAPKQDASLAERLHEFAQRAPAGLRPRAEWMAALLTGHFENAATAFHRNVPAPLPGLVAASDMARRGDAAGALRQTDPLIEVESARAEDPFFRAALHLLRADWQERLGHTRTADLELTWYENSDVNEFPTGPPQPSEVDWAFGVLARWRRARLAAAAGDEVCRLDGDIARLWADGEPRYAARADSARRDAATRRCGERPG